MPEPMITLPTSVVREAIAALDEGGIALRTNNPAWYDIAASLFELRRAVWLAALQGFLDCFGFKEGA